MRTATRTICIVSALVLVSGIIALTNCCDGGGDNSLMLLPNIQLRGGDA
ncbi:MAG: hypothetical protein JXA20_20325 [Spirochaetes bacterium]|nr:hypothetical protein [Spirochaetota bacterium]